MESKIIYYSNCCSSYLPNYEISDICPKCKEHCLGVTLDAIMENERYVTPSDLGEDEFDTEEVY